MSATASLPEAAAAPGDDDPAAHESAACLRPYCCNPFAAFSAFSRVGGWTPPLPDAGAVPEGDATA
ncbi:hypothetical protein G3O00_04265 [Burkholderia sp. Ac-20384]|uniref:hypothetical protein n=1 Tax=Burkholderia TaxID=32008 RepID=UPI0014546FFC|nr:MULTISPECIES: hypothetical protein [Burkholderia]MBN3822832.1 hypothetical protein [Burkholderia sp. Ac-20384]VWB22908.1 hypothetical protein BLA6993_00926 [Burkholderia lata]